MTDEADEIVDKAKEAMDLADALEVVTSYHDVEIVFAAALAMAASAARERGLDWDDLVDAVKFAWTVEMAANVDPESLPPAERPS